MSEGSAGDALLSAISLIPGGDIVKVGKIGKDISTTLVINVVLSFGG